MHPGRIYIDRLIQALGFNSQHLVTRRLRLAGGNAQLLPQNMVQQGGFTDVGAANYRDETTATVRILRAGNIVHQGVSTPSCFSALRAASCSAIRRLLPTPLVLRSSEGNTQDT